MLGHDQSRNIVDEHPLLRRSAPAGETTPGVGEALCVIAVDALVVVVLALNFSCIAARKNRLTTWPMSRFRTVIRADLRASGFQQLCCRDRDFDQNGGMS